MHSYKSDRGFGGLFCCFKMYGLVPELESSLNLYNVSGISVTII